MIKNCSLTVLLTLGIFSVVGGQDVAIDKSVFDSKVESAQSLFRSVSYKVQRVSESLNAENKIVYTSKYTTEILRPDRRRFVSTFIRDGKETTSETISIGPRNYYRRNNGPWTTEEEASASASGACGGQASYESYKTLNQKDLPDKSTTVYEHVLRMKSSCYDGIRGEFTEEEITTDRYWINDKGQLVKETSEREDVKTHELNRSTTTYDYQAKFKIEAPIK